MKKRMERLNILARNEKENELLKKFKIKCYKLGVNQKDAIFLLIKKFSKKLER